MSAEVFSAGSLYRPTLTVPYGTPQAAGTASFAQSIGEGKR
jgi:hypothetical protein